jgi:hypothetical protein
MLALGWKLAAMFALAGAFYALALLALGFVRLDRSALKQLIRVRWPGKSFS